MSINPVQQSSVSGSVPLFALGRQESEAYRKMRSDVVTRGEKIGENGSALVMGIAKDISDALASRQITRVEAQTLMNLARKTIDEKSEFGAPSIGALTTGLRNIAYTKTPGVSEERREAAKTLLRDVFFQKG